jgi:hypothetical protein
MSTNEETIQSDPLSSLGGAFDTAAKSIGDATTDARESAKIAARKVKESARSGVYNISYGVSFGVVFTAVFLVELLPEDNVVRRGFEDGAEAGFDSAIAKAEAGRARRRAYVEKPAP